MKRQIGPVERVPASTCWQCGKLLTARALVDETYDAEVPDVTICLACTAVSVFLPDLTLRRPTEAEMAALLDDPEFVRAQCAVALAIALR